MTELPERRATDDRRVIVVGGSLAGLRAAEGVRRGGFAGEIVVIDGEPHMPYNRPPLSKGGRKAEQLDAGSLALRMPRALDDVRWLLGTHVVQADLAARRVRIDDGTVLEYDGLICATGLDARRLPQPEARAQRHVVRTVEDAKNLFAGIERAGSLVVIGAGFLGCEVASVVAREGYPVTVVAPEVVPMQRPLGAWVGEALLRRHRAAGVDFRLGRGIVSLTERDGMAELTLDDGEILRTSAVLEAIGGVPAVSWLDGSGLDLRDGIETDSCLRVGGRDEVYACGDVARWPNRLASSEARRIEHWTTAAETGRAAGRNLAAQLAGGSPQPFETVPSFWSDQVGLRVQSFGSPGLADAPPTLLEGDADAEFVAGYFRASELVGVVLVGLPERIAYYRELVQATLVGASS